MTRRPTIRDVARAAGVSTVTVSRVANAPALVRPATRARVEAAMRHLGYAPNAAAQSMRTRVSRTVGFMVPDLTNYPNAAVAKAAEAVLADAGYYLLLTDSDHEPAREERFLRLLRSRQVDGIILYLSDEDDPRVHATIRALDVPVVVLDRTLPFALDTVFSEHAAAIEALVRALVLGGRRRLHLLLPDLRIRPVRARAAAFQQAVRRADLPPDAQKVSYGDPARVDVAAIERIVDAPARPDALLIDGNRLLAAAFEVLRERGIEIPRELALIAIDAVEPLAAALPEIVGIARDFGEIGRSAATLLIDRLSGALEDGPMTIELPSRMLRPAEPPESRLWIGSGNLRC